MMVCIMCPSDFESETKHAQSPLVSVSTAVDLGLAPWTNYLSNSNLLPEAAFVSTPLVC